MQKDFKISAAQFFLGLQTELGVGGRGKGRINEMLCFVSSWIKLAQCETYGGGGAYLFISALAVCVYVGVCPRSRPTVSDDNGC